MPKSEKELRAELDHLDKQRAKISSQLKARNERDSRNFPRTPTISLWVPIREFVKANGGSATSTEILEAMIAAGHELGKYPFRTVVASFQSRHCKNVFDTVVTKDPDTKGKLYHVKLHASGELHYMPLPNSRAVAQASKVARAH